MIFKTMIEVKLTREDMELAIKEYIAKHDQPNEQITITSMTSNEVAALISYKSEM